MLRISVTTRPGGATVTLEGRLAGLWVDELARCWSSVTALRDASAVRVELEAVTFIDLAGKAALRRMREEGAVLFASGCMTRAILEEIETGRRERSMRRR
jgi:ABC-type transporter Mla MlaB component